VKILNNKFIPQNLVGLQHMPTFTFGKAVAQLEEHQRCTLEVAGSSPASLTTYFSNSQAMSLLEEPLFSPEEWQACIKVLQVLSRNPKLAEDSPVMKGLVAKLNRQARKSIRKQNQQQKGAHDRLVSENTIRYQQEPKQMASQTLLPQSLPLPPVIGQLLKQPRACYICKNSFQEVHFFYHLLCPACAQLNCDRRVQRTDLKGSIVLLTGGRIKIGFETGLKMLRDGAKVIVTSRFPQDTAKRYAKEPDFDVWKDYLQIYALDLRNIRAVEEFIEHLVSTLPHLDIIINNAAQTIRRPLEFYRSLLMAENISLLELPTSQRQLLAAPHTFVQTSEIGEIASLSLYFPDGLVDRHGQQADLRPNNSWRLPLEEVETAELLEVQLVNAIAPFLFNSKLKSLLLQSPAKRRFIVNVSAMEGQFNRPSKTKFHPHTNMAKAALNMMTRTSAAAYAEEGIYMNSVDTGWITDEDPYPRKRRKHANGFVPPLDEIDGAARIYDPIVQGIKATGQPFFGHFLKDYQSHSW
jgi:NAD(P)-dependent dehydrogenase (short-subunit alcohol dehydrogenase family)